MHQPRDRIVQSVQRLHDRAEHQCGQRRAGQGKHNDQKESGACSVVGIFHHAPTLCNSDRVDPFHQRAQRLVDLGTVATRTGQKGVSNYAVAVGVGVDRIHRLCNVGLDLRSDPGNDLGIAPDQLFELRIELDLRSLRRKL